MWAALQAMLTGAPLGPDSDTFEPHGPFAIGTEITVTPQGQEATTSVITELQPGEVYADRTVYGDLVLTFRHRLTPVDGGTSVAHILEIDGAGWERIGPELGPRISGGFPVAMAELLAAAERGVRA